MARRRRGPSNVVAVRYLPAATLVAAAVALLPPTAALAAHAPFRFEGGTSQHLPVSFQIPWSFIGVRKLVIDWDARCTSGALLTGSTGFRRTLVFNRNGPGWNYPGSYRYTMVDPDYTASNGRQLSFRVALRNAGRTLYDARVKGTWRATTTVSDPVSGQVIDTCATGRVTWKADLL
jgi:hypothetical protein